MFDHSRIYLDHASATPVSRRAQKAFTEALSLFGNPSSPHQEGRVAKELLEAARQKIAGMAEVKPDAVIFTSSATEANALAIRGAVAGSGKLLAQIHLLYLPTQHASVVHAMEALAKEGAFVEELTITDGAIDLEALAGQLRPETLLISVDAVCGETGTRFNTRDVRRVLTTQKSSALIHVDASQLPRAESFVRARLGADMITLDAQKVGGVRGIGALIASRGTALKALMEGGGQERGLRPGTESPALASAFAEALTEAEENRTPFTAAAETLRGRLIEGMRESVVVNEGKEHAPHILNVSLPGQDTDYLVALLDEAGIAVATKSACETDEEGSRAVLALTGDAERARSTLRVSVGPETAQRDVDAFLAAYRKAAAFIRSTQVPPVDARGIL